jgi:hypothetical protein
MPLTGLAACVWPLYVPHGGEVRVGGTLPIPGYADIGLTLSEASARADLPLLIERRCRALAL